MSKEYVSINMPSAGKHYPLKVRNSESVTIAHTPEFRELDDPNILTREALDNPIGTSRIEDMVKPGDKVCIVSDDVSRPTPVYIVLEELLPRLLKAGVYKEDIFIVLALGSHRPMNKEEMIQKLGREVVEQYTVMNSEFSNPDLLKEVGNSQMGTPIRVFKPAMEADFRIGIGSILPHGCMGWSGGAKILYPGITSEDIVSEFHMMQGFQDGIVYGMDECPIRITVEEWTKQIGLHFIINMVLTGETGIYKVVAGDYVKAHRVGVEHCKEVLGVPIKKRPNIVVTSSYPTEMDMWQCSKGVYAAGKVVEKGGTIILLAPCVEGIGPHKKYSEYLGMENGFCKLKESVDNKQLGEDLLTMAVGVSIGKLHDYCNIHWLSNGCTKEEIDPSGFIWHKEEDIQKVFDEVLTQYKDPEILIIPNGAETVPYFI